MWNTLPRRVELDGSGLNQMRASFPVHNVGVVDVTVRWGGAGARCNDVWRGCQVRAGALPRSMSAVLPNDALLSPSTRRSTPLPSCPKWVKRAWSPSSCSDCLTKRSTVSEVAQRVLGPLPWLQKPHLLTCSDEGGSESAQWQL